MLFIPQVFLQLTFPSEEDRGSCSNSVATDKQAARGPGWHPLGTWASPSAHVRAPRGCWHFQSHPDWSLLLPAPHNILLLAGIPSSTLLPHPRHLLISILENRLRDICPSNTLIGGTERVFTQVSFSAPKQSSVPPATQRGHFSVCFSRCLPTPPSVLRSKWIE